MADPVSLAITVALNAASMALTMMQKSEGPRLDDLTVTTADYGTPLVQFYGTCRLEMPCFYAENIKEKKKKTKTKGGKYTEYEYFGTWANFIADHEISAVLKVWLDRHLVFDLTNDRPIAMVILEAVMDAAFDKGQDQFRTYFGTEDQAPDPRMLAKIEKKEGAGMCPAYLGVSYLFWEDTPLEKFGNRLPQASALVTRVAIPKYLTDHVGSTSELTGGNMGFSAGGVWMVYPGASGQMDWFHLPTRTLFGTGYTTPTFGTSNTNYTTTPDGVTYTYGVGGPPVPGVYFFTYSEPLAIPSAEFVPGYASIFVDRCRALPTAHGFPGEYDVYGTYDSVAGYITGATAIVHDQSMRDVCIHESREHFGLFHPTGSSADYTIENVSTITSLVSETFTGAQVRGAVTPASICYSSTYGTFFVWTDGHFYIHDGETLELLNSGVLTIGFSDIRARLPSEVANRTSFWDGFNEYSLEDGSLIRTVASTNWVPFYSGSGYQYDSTNHAIWARDSGFSGNLTVFLLDRKDGGPWTLGQICADTGEQAGLEPDDYDFTDLDQEVLGYCWTQGPAKEVIGALLEIHDSDIRPHGFIQQGLKRGQPLSADTIQYTFMVPERGSAGEHTPLYSLPMVAETDLPRRVFSTFADPDKENQPNVAHAQRNAASVKTNREVTYDFSTLSIVPDDMQPLLERALRRAWVGATKPECKLSPLEVRLEPADTRVLNFEGEFLRCRAIRTKIRANRIIDTEWEVDGETLVLQPDWEDDVAASVHVTYSSPGGTTGGREDDEVPILMQTRGFILDFPLFSDADDQTTPFLYAAAAPLTSGGYWPGTAVWVAEDVGSEFDVGWDTFSTDEVATYGLCQSTLQTAITEVIDEGSWVYVRMMNGDVLETISDDTLLASTSANLAVIGSELVQFRTAELVDTDTYLLSGFVRGARGTEYAVASHGVNERFLLIGEEVHSVDMGASEIGDTDYYRFSSTGSDLDASPTQTVEFAANAHRPLSPAHVTLVRDTGTGDWAIDWIRRSRIGGATVNGQDVPLGETSELYRVKIMDGDDVLATYDVTTEDKLYTAAEQTADWGGPQTSLDVSICQMSPALSLEGFPTTASA